MEKQLTEITQAIKSQFLRFKSALNDGNSNDMASFYTESGMLLPNGDDIVQGKNHIARYWQKAIDIGLYDIELEFLEMDIQNNTVIETSRYALSDAHQQVIEEGKGIVIWKNNTGEWKIHRDIWNSNII